MYFAAHKELNFLNPESHKIFRKIVEEIQIGIFLADARDNLFFVNRAFADIFEFQASIDALGQHWEKVCFLDIASKAEFMNKMNTVGVVKDFEISHVHPISYKQRYLTITANYIVNDQRERIGIQGFVANVSDVRRLEENIVLEHQKLEQILDFCNCLGGLLNVDDLTKYIVQQTARILDVKRCSIMLCDAKSQELFINASIGMDYKDLTKVRVRLGDPVAGLVAQKGESVWVEDIEKDIQFKRVNRNTYAKHAFMSTPLFYNKKLIGVINVSEKNGRFSKLDLKVLETIALQAAAHIHKTEMLSNFELLSRIDAKTGLYNYFSFERKVEDEISRTKRYGIPFSMMMIDVDNFKTFNDSKGHLEGDRLLKKLAEIFKGNLRSTEFICRYGGDEFGVIMPQTDGAQASLVGEKIREKVNKEFAKENISISVGIAQYQSDASKEAFIQQADEALYKSKKSGRNKVSLQ